MVAEKLHHPVEIGAVLASCFGYVVNPIGQNSGMMDETARRKSLTARVPWASGKLILVHSWYAFPGFVASCRDPAP